MSNPVPNAKIIASNDRVVEGYTDENGRFVAELIGDKAEVLVTKKGYVGNIVSVPLPYAGLLTIPIRKLTFNKLIGTIPRYDCVGGASEKRDDDYYVYVILRSLDDYVIVFRFSTHDVVFKKKVVSPFLKNNVVMGNYFISWESITDESGNTTTTMRIYNKFTFDVVRTFTFDGEVTSVAVCNNTKLFVMRYTGDAVLEKYDIETSDKEQTLVIASGVVPKPFIVCFENYIWVVYGDGANLHFKKCNPDTLQVVLSSSYTYEHTHILGVGVAGGRFYIPIDYSMAGFHSYDTAVFNPYTGAVINVSDYETHNMFIYDEETGHVINIYISGTTMYIKEYDVLMQTLISSRSVDVGVDSVVLGYAERRAVVFAKYIVPGTNVRVWGFRYVDIGDASISDLDIGTWVDSVACHGEYLCHDALRYEPWFAWGIAYISPSLDRYVVIDDEVTPYAVVAVSVDEPLITYQFRGDIQIAYLCRQPVLQSRYIYIIRYESGSGRYYLSKLDLETLSYEDELDVTNVINYINGKGYPIYAVDVMEDAVIFSGYYPDTYHEYIVAVDRGTGEIIRDTGLYSNYCYYEGAANKRYTLWLCWSSYSDWFEVFDIYTGQRYIDDSSWIWESSNQLVLLMRVLAVGKYIIVCLSRTKYQIIVFNRETGEVVKRLYYEHSFDPSFAYWSHFRVWNDTVIETMVQDGEPPRLRYGTLNMVTGEEHDGYLGDNGKYMQNPLAEPSQNLTYNGYMLITGDRYPAIDVYEVVRSSMVIYTR